MDSEEVISERYLRLVYGHGHHGPQPKEAWALRRQHPWLRRRHEWAEGRLGTDAPGWGMHPLIALTHSCFARTSEKTFTRSVETLLNLGADPNVFWENDGCRLSALYGAAGKNHSPVLTRMLLTAGANPNDGESLYHAVESEECVKLLLKAGAKPQGTNALARSLDAHERLPVTRLLLKAGADPAEGPGGGALFWALRRRRSLVHVKLLLAHGADPHARFRGISTYQAAMWMGLPAAGALLRKLTNAAPLEGRDAFLAACACGDEYQARAELQRQPDLIRLLPADLLALLPLQVEADNAKGAMLMVKLGWPLSVKGADWRATALNLAVFRGNAKLTRFLLEHGATWRETHGFGDNVRGTLAYASRERPVKAGDWKACGEALQEFGMLPL